MPVLKLKKDDPKRELEFEVSYQLSISAQKRLSMWLKWNLEMLKFAKRRQNERRKINKIIKRS